MPGDVSQYLRTIQQALQAGDATEGTHRPVLKAFVESLRPAVTATNEPRRVECGAPDYSVKRGGLTIGYIEAKDVGKSLDEAERSEQLKRYRSLPNLILTDYLEFRWYVDGERRAAERLARVGRHGKLVSDGAGAQAVIELLQNFLDHAPEEIAKPLELAQRMASLTHEIRTITANALRNGRASPLLMDLRESFARTLLPDLKMPEKAGEFADMYAQTLAYGLFAARCNHRGPKGSFRRLGAAREIPKTNPFLRRLFETITGSALDDEPYAGYVDDLVQLLAHADMGSILAEFGKRTKQEDPVVHFYETFLAAYDPKLREMRGVYYTPEPVVSYIVRSVDYLLRGRFGLAGGLADTSTVKYQRKEKDKEPREEEAPRVLILDPACGTGTFLYVVVDLIRRQFMTDNNAGMWSGFVKDHLLPRLFGFELLMAPYAVAHLKLGMQLAGQDLSEAQRRIWAYDFSGGERLGIYLTNTLEQAERDIQPLFGPLRVITEEANAALRIKREMPILVVMGNPPYSGHSANRSWEVVNGKRRRTFIGKLLQDYYKVDGKPLGERNPKWLQDDYVKFIRWGQWRIARSGGGILALITNHGYLDNPTFRGMRQQLLKAFTEIYILDLHGSSKKKERAPDGSKDENVFDIQQGVAIGIFVKEPGKRGPAKVHHAELWGSRAQKHKRLRAENVALTRWRQCRPRSPFYLMRRIKVAARAEFQRSWPIARVMPVNVLGFQTHRDHFAVAFTMEEIERRIKDMRNRRLDDHALLRDYELNPGWDIRTARASLQADPCWRSAILACSYRPFDTRVCFLGSAVTDRPRPELLRHVANRRNICLLTARQQAVPGYRHCWVARDPANDCVVSSTSREANQVFPLYLYPHPGSNGDLFSNGRDRHVNLSAGFIAEAEKKTGLRFIEDGTGDLKSTFGPEDVFHYIYAVLHSPAYRERYAEFLRIDFPRVPLTSDRGLFRTFCRLGAELVALHLLESPALQQPVTNFPIGGDNRVEKGYPKYYAPGERAPGSDQPIDEGRVYVNRTQYFNGVPENVWQFHIGGYQVCEKWLKDRRGRLLSFDDVHHYGRISVALNETIRLMAEIDEAITDWPIQ